MYRLGPKRFLNLGCGPNIESNFVNLDYLWRPGMDLCWDISKGALPFDNCIFEGVYTEHCLEHITFACCESVLKEIFRVLKPGATVRIVVPDAELYIDLYCRFTQGEDVTFPYVKSVSREEFSPIMPTNRISRDHGHLYAYDARCLEIMLGRAGFVGVRKVGFKQGGVVELLIVSEGRKLESLYIEARKP